MTVTPDDAGRDPVRGRLVALTAHEVVVARHGEEVGDVHVHVPRVGFDVEGAPGMPEVGSGYPIA